MSGISPETIDLENEYLGDVKEKGASIIGAATDDSMPEFSMEGTRFRFEIRLINFLELEIFIGCGEIELRKSLSDPDANLFEMAKEILRRWEVKEKEFPLVGRVKA